MKYWITFIVATTVFLGWWYRITDDAAAKGQLWPGYEHDLCLHHWDNQKGLR